VIYKKTLVVLYLLFCFAEVCFSQQESEITWRSPIENNFDVVNGQGWPNETKSNYHRFPLRAKEKLRKPVWDLSKQSAGLSIRFLTNADSIFVRYKLKGEISLPHMQSTGVSGLDLFAKSYNKQWIRCVGKYAINKNSSYKFAIEDEYNSYKDTGREFQLFLPLYNEVLELEIGVNQQFLFDVLPIKKEKPIVVYGTSISQGACASRPGMAWTNILERRLNTPLINLGFSGNGELEPTIIDLISEIDAKLYILDCLPNLDPYTDNIYKLVLDAVKKLKERKPDIPIILTDHIGYVSSLLNRKNRYKENKINVSMERAFYKLQNEGYIKIYILKKEAIDFCSDSYVDDIHPNDYGMIKYADAYQNLIEKILKN